ncbi:MAG: adenosylmethionine--8-amino-7-oxononanoate transaminase [Planctomycetota bacterium]|jgi:adenosylmethionine-8-amino-7-oxononanoate aminotransferase
MDIDDLVRRDLDVLWHPCAQMRDYDDFAPLAVVGARACELSLADGSTLIDAISSWWCKALGHGHPHLRAALIEQAERFEHVILANTTNEPIVRLSERILALANGAPPAAWASTAAPGRQPGHFGKVFYADNGSTAVEVAVKMALQAQAQRGHHQRTRFVALGGGYHGETVATLALGDCGLYGAPYRPLMFEVPMLSGLPYRQGPDDPCWQDASGEWPAIEAQLDAHSGQVAAIVYEPVLQGAGGMQLYSPDLLRRLRAWADANDVYLIADEIAAGMGRCGTMLAGHLAGIDVQPDFACLSKGLTGGMLPLSAVVTSDAIYDLFLADYGQMRAFLHSNTYTGNALAVAVANAALDVFADAAILDQVAQRGPLLRQGLADMAKTRPYLGPVRGVGMMAAIDLQGFDSAARTGYQIYREAVRRGALLRPLGDTLYLFPPLVMDDATIARTLAILADSLDAVIG